MVIVQWPCQELNLPECICLSCYPYILELLHKSTIERMVEKAAFFATLCSSFGGHNEIYLKVYYMENILR